MNELRWILIGFGIVLLAAIYLWGRRGNRAVASDDAAMRTRPEPTMQNAESTPLRTAESPWLRAPGATPPDPVELAAAPPVEAPDHPSPPAPHDSGRGRLEP